MNIDLEKEAKRIRLMRCYEAMQLLKSLKYVTESQASRVRLKIFKDADKNGIEYRRLISEMRDEV